MTQQVSSPESGDDRPTPAEPRKRKSFRVILGEKSGDPSNLKPTTARLVPLPGERLTPKELKERFATNLDRFLGLVGLTRRDAAVEIGISYPLLKRLVTAGVSRTDDRNLQSLSRITAFFALPKVEDLWRADLIRLMLVDNADNFISKFRTRMLAVRERRLVETGPVRMEELSLLNCALGFEATPALALTGPYAEMATTILASPKADTFKRMIEDYYELATRPAIDDPAESRERSRAAQF